MPAYQATASSRDDRKRADLAQGDSLGSFRPRPVGVGLKNTDGVRPNAKILEQEQRKLAMEEMESRLMLDEARKKTQEAERKSAVYLDILTRVNPAVLAEQGWKIENGDLVPIEQPSVRIVLRPTHLDLNKSQEPVEGRPIDQPLPTAALDTDDTPFVDETPVEIPQRVLIEESDVEAKSEVVNPLPVMAPQEELPRVTQVERPAEQKPEVDIQPATTEKVAPTLQEAYKAGREAESGIEIKNAVVFLNGFAFAESSSPADAKGPIDSLTQTENNTGFTMLEDGGLKKMMSSPESYLMPFFGKYMEKIKRKLTPEEQVLVVRRIKDTLLIKDLYENGKESFVDIEGAPLDLIRPISEAIQSLLAIAEPLKIKLQPTSTFSSFMEEIKDKLPEEHIS